MSITDELRGFAPHLDLGKVALAGWKEALLAIADRIDAAHEKECREQYENGLNDGIDDGIDESFASVDDWLTNNEDEMAEHGWIRLPKDANNEYIHIGDVMEVINSKQRAEACYMQMGPSGTWAVGLAKNCHWYDIESLRHHATTVEDVLREFALACEDAGNAGPEVERIATEYAAKLQLRKDE